VDTQQHTLGDAKGDVLPLPGSETRWLRPKDSCLIPEYPSHRFIGPTPQLSHLAECVMSYECGVLRAIVHGAYR